VGRVVGRRIGPVVVLVVRERHVADAERRVHAQQPQIVVDHVAAFHAHQRGDLVIRGRLSHIRGGRREHQIVGMRADRFAQVGVVMINYHAAFLSEEFRVASEKKSGNVFGATDAVSTKCGGNEACATLEGERIDHGVKIAGIDHVGLGSDFDGATMPLGMEDASKLPKITDALLKKGYSEADVEKILGGNILRVMEAVERLKGP
jgi:hypothetical protein